MHTLKRCPGKMFTHLPTANHLCMFTTPSLRTEFSPNPLSWNIKKHAPCMHPCTNNPSSRWPAIDQTIFWSSRGWLGLMLMVQTRVEAKAMITRAVVGEVRLQCWLSARPSLTKSSSRNDWSRDTSGTPNAMTPSWRRSWSAFVSNFFGHYYAANMHVK